MISGNGGEGISVFSGDGQTIRGNYIGTNAAGTAAVPNLIGMNILNGSSGDTIGGSTAGEATSSRAIRRTGSTSTATAPSNRTTRSTAT